MAPEPFVFGPAFRKEHCDFCGDCLEKCPVLALPREEAVAAMHALAEGGATRVLDECTGCMACNTFCPNGANPHTLILSRWEDRYKREGLPAQAALVLPHQKRNLYARAGAWLPADERRLAASWEANWRNPPAAETMIFTGCNALLQPFLLQSPIFDGVPAFGSVELCCGEPLYRMGCWDAARTVALHLRDEFARMGPKRILMPCLACFHLFKHVYPGVFGVELGVEVVSLYDWLIERIEGGALPVTPLGKRAVPHDSCWPKASGDVQFDSVRRLLSIIGVEAVEPEHTREAALCCGMCAAASRLRLRDVVSVAKTRLAELDRADADFSVDYCGGCHWLFALVGRLPGAKPQLPMYHVIEAVQMAAGERVERRVEERVGSLAKHMAGPMLRAYLSPSRFRIESVAGRPVLPRDQRES